MLRNFKTERGHHCKPDGMNMGKHGKGGGSGGANLNYTDDKLESYSDIWNAEVTESEKTDRARVVVALKGISEKENVERYIDLEQVLKYMAVHNFSVNEDSLSGNMADFGYGVWSLSVRLCSSGVPR